MKRLVFICTVNRWRSPMAEYLFRDLLEKRGDNLHKRIVISSSGIIPKEEKALQAEKGFKLPDPLFGYKPHICVMHHLMKRGIDASAHQSKALSKEAVDQTDMIISVVDKHKESLEKAHPTARKKVFSLEALSKPFNLPKITGEPPGLMPADKFCVLECDHWEFTDNVMCMVEERLIDAMDRILKFLAV